ncbi:hypothetical protein [Dyella choica]|uniref:Uncharacterized protein n=1 Tax=Dyella choica TaxID=1927959 RepID=A0A3S0Q6M6_9GAMM|nr:hypothetical protein [Dyella choica]RUL78932.1 hypothetical protein EKH80_03790 [Dyella choica]
MTIALHIERLVLDAALLDGERGEVVRSAIERELAQRLAGHDPEVLRHIGAVASLPVQNLPQATLAHISIGARVAAATGNALGLSPAGQGDRRR